jgi:hypothetical protein
MVSLSWHSCQCSVLIPVWPAKKKKNRDQMRLVPCLYTLKLCPYVCIRKYGAMLLSIPSYLWQCTMSPLCFWMWQIFQSSVAIIVQVHAGRKHAHHQWRHKFEHRKMANMYVSYLPFLQLENTEYAESILLIKILPSKSKQFLLAIVLFVLLR